MFAAVERNQLDRISLLVDLAAHGHGAILHLHKPTLVFGGDVVARLDNRMNNRVPVSGSSNHGEIWAERHGNETGGRSRAQFDAAAI